MLPITSPEKEILPHFLRALMETGAAFSVCVAVGGLFFLPAKKSPLDETSRTISFAALDVPNQQLFGVCVERNSPSTPAQLHFYDLSEDKSRLHRNLPVNNPSCLAHDVNHGRLFIGDLEGVVHAVSYRDDRVQCLARVSRGSVRSLTCTQDGEALIVQEVFGITAWNVGQLSDYHSSPRWNLLEPDILCVATTVSTLASKVPAQTAIYCRALGESCELVEVEMATGKSKPMGVRFSEHVLRMVVSPDNQRMVCVLDSGTVRCLSRTALDLSWTLQSDMKIRTGLASTACFSPDSQLLLTSNPPSLSLMCWHVQSGQKVQHYEATASCLRGCDFLDAQRFMSWHEDGTVRVWDLNISAPGKEVRVFQ
jgi:WD40 repeat protein